mmetsp:Transcript_25799/g.58898  ORF Transcript_25799/g.58898 Transcript_25799/m.58898 type:complete len:330 (-) Transcript_25799:7-996(-)
MRKQMGSQVGGTLGEVASNLSMRREAGQMGVAQWFRGKYKTVVHPVSSFGVDIEVVVRRERAVVASTGGEDMDRPPLVLENMLAQLWRALTVGARPNGTQHSVMSLITWDRRTANAGEAIETLKRTLDDSPASAALRPPSPPALGDKKEDAPLPAAGGEHDFAADADRPALPPPCDAPLLFALLRDYLAELPEPLLTFRLCPRILDASPRVAPDWATSPPDAAGGGPDGTRMQLALTSLPRAHYVTAKRVLTALHRLSRLPDPSDAPGAPGTPIEQAVSRGEVRRALALALGPALLRRNNAVAPMSSDLPAVCAAMDAMIHHAPALFSS